MPKKFWLAVFLVIIAAYAWNKYGYLIQSYRNFPSTTNVSTAPANLDPTSGSGELSYLHPIAGYSISYYAKDVPGARSLTVGGNGVVYVGTRPQGVVYALEDRDGDGRAETRYVVASGLNNPNGVAYSEGTLYVAEINRIIKFEHIDQTYADKPNYSVIYNDLPKDSLHGWRYMAFGPDHKLYLGLGANCNVCELHDPYGTIARLNLDGSGFEIVARGIRNTVGFDWNPEDQSLWFTENGRDLLGEDVPRDELNQVRGDHEHFGFPYCHEGDILDPKYGVGKNCADYAAPSLDLSPHAAALGMKFIGHKIILAEHGSWNRKTPIGYRLMSIDMTNGVASNYQVFVDGWLGEDGKAKGRPVDVLERKDGSILVSDDFAGAVYLLRSTQAPAK